MKERKQELQDLEKKLDQRDARLDNRSINLDKREESLAKKEQKLEEQREALEKRSNRVEELILEQENKLFEIASLNMDEARAIVFERVENEIQMDIALYLKEQEEKAKNEAKRKAQTILANAIQQYANETVQEKTVSVIALPNDDMKGRIIGREGRNIRHRSRNRRRSDYR